MSLKILLADGSASIYKVFQLGLQDLEAEIKSVQNGPDALQIAESYQPDIVFVDVLIKKKNGYEIVKKLKQNPKTGHIPVVLMWSSFMELDQEEYQNCGAEAELEKPFDVENMRQVLHSLVKKHKNQKIYEFLDFPENTKTDSSDEKQPHQAENKDDNFNPLFTSSEQQLKKEEPAVEEDHFFDPFEKGDSFEQNDESFSVFNLNADETPDSGQTHGKKEENPPKSPRETESSDLKLSDPEEISPNESTEQEESIKTEQKKTNKDEFQPVDLQSDKKLDLNDFLYQPESNRTSTETPQPKIKQEAENQKSVKNEAPLIQKDPSPFEGFDKKDLSQKSTVPEKQNLISPEVQATLEKAIKDQLPGIVEKVVREELEKLFQQETALKESDQD